MPSPETINKIAEITRAKNRETLEYSQQIHEAIAALDLDKAISLTRKRDLLQQRTTRKVKKLLDSEGV